LKPAPYLSVVVVGLDPRMAEERFGDKVMTSTKGGGLFIS
jgi:hypothetical protein